MSERMGCAYRAGDPRQAEWYKLKKKLLTMHLNFPTAWAAPHHRQQTTAGGRQEHTCTPSVTESDTHSSSFHSTQGAKATPSPLLLPSRSQHSSPRCGANGETIRTKAWYRHTANHATRVWRGRTRPGGGGGAHGQIVACTLEGKRRNTSIRL